MQNLLRLWNGTLKSRCLVGLFQGKHRANIFIIINVLCKYCVAQTNKIALLQHRHIRSQFATGAALYDARPRKGRPVWHPFDITPASGVPRWNSSNIHPLSSPSPFLMRSEVLATLCTFLPILYWLKMEGRGGKEKPRLSLSQFPWPPQCNHRHRPFNATQGRGSEIDAGRRPERRVCEGFFFLSFFLCAFHSCWKVCLLCCGWLCIDKTRWEGRLAMRG